MTQPGARPPATPATGVTYVFAVFQDARARTVAEAGGLAGMPGGAAVRVLPSGSLAALVQTVPAADFTDEAWQERLTDLRELETYARAHHTVVSAVAGRCPTVPLPLATLYHDDARAQEELCRESERFHAALRRIAYRSEWGVKVYASAPGTDEPEPAPAPTRAVPGAGLAYLNRKRGVQERREWRREQALRLAETVDAELRAFAEASRRLRVETREDREVQVLNATYLIGEHQVEEFALLVDTVRERTGGQIELSGPWVPYSFVGEA
ncbi:GvpL/GvpF family gas vesicle protein [Streptomyces sp. NPDC001985]|uniref:GvpL/GvpF family gas vesicle protein n=1 Tax=Streptomyces sp. NPDC001985 TaxID=3154406 RepID=UPI0033346C24